MIIDLTHLIDNNSPMMQWAKAQKNKHVAMGHVGTHLDIYNKSTVPLEYFKSNGILFDVVGKKEVEISDIDLDKIQKDSFVLFHTGQIEKYAYGDKLYFDNHPQLSQELINALIYKKVRFIGVDCAGIRQHEQHEQADRLCESNNIYVIENLKNLAKITDNKFIVYTMWLDDSDMTGLKCRVIIEQ